MTTEKAVTSPKVLAVEINKQAQKIGLTDKTFPEAAASTLLCLIMESWDAMRGKSTGKKDVRKATPILNEAGLRVSFSSKSERLYNAVAPFLAQTKCVDVERVAWEVLRGSVQQTSGIAAADRFEKKIYAMRNSL